MRRAILSKQFTEILRPNHCVDVVLDTDTYNEIDDAYALTYLLRSPEHIHLQAIYAAPFLLEGRSVSPKDGMEKSFQEAEKLLDLYRVSYQDYRPEPPLFRGCDSFLRDEVTAVSSEAVRDLIARSKNIARHSRYM